MEIDIELDRFITTILKLEKTPENVNLVSDWELLEKNLGILLQRIGKMNGLF